MLSPKKTISTKRSTPKVFVDPNKLANILTTIQQHHPKTIYIKEGENDWLPVSNWKFYNPDQRHKRQIDDKYDYYVCWIEVTEQHSIKSYLITGTEWGQNNKSGNWCRQNPIQVMVTQQQITIVKLGEELVNTQQQLTQANKTQELLRAKIVQLKKGVLKQPIDDVKQPSRPPECQLLHNKITLLINELKWLRHKNRIDKQQIETILNIDISESCHSSLSDEE